MGCVIKCNKIHYSECNNFTCDVTNTVFNYNIKLYVYKMYR